MGIAKWNVWKLVKINYMKITLCALLRKDPDRRCNYDTVFI